VKLWRGKKRECHRREPLALLETEKMGTNTQPEEGVCQKHEGDRGVLLGRGEKNTAASSTGWKQS